MKRGMNSGLFTHTDRPMKRKPIGEHNTDGLMVFTTSLEKK
jgi:hypothetical protein